MQKTSELRRRGEESALANQRLLPFLHYMAIRDASPTSAVNMNKANLDAVKEGGMWVGVEWRQEAILNFFVMLSTSCKEI